MATKKTNSITIRRSGIHGRGVYAARRIKKGERVVEYKGERISWKEALRRHPHDPDDPNHTFYFTLEDDLLIDGGAQGNAARWINHSCDPNCEASMVEVKGEMRVFIEAVREIKKGEELSYDYGLEVDARYTPKLKKEFACHCGSADCRGTMLAKKR
jgi:SET domain-containing protein